MNEKIKPIDVYSFGKWRRDPDNPPVDYRWASSSGKRPDISKLTFFQNDMDLAHDYLMFNLNDSIIEIAIGSLWSEMEIRGYYREYLQTVHAMFPTKSILHFLENGMFLNINRFREVALSQFIIEPNMDDFVFSPVDVPVYDSDVFSKDEVKKLLVMIVKTLFIWELHRPNISLSFEKLPLSYLGKKIDYVALLPFIALFFGRINNKSFSLSAPISSSESEVFDWNSYSQEILNVQRVKSGNVYFDLSLFSDKIDQIIGS